MLYRQNVTYMYMLFNWENGLGVARHGVYRLWHFRRIHLGLRELELVEAAAQ